MYDPLFDGYCPQCLLDENRLSMKLNRGDVWECPECRLLVATAPPFRAVVLRRRGNGNLRNPGDGRYDATRHVTGHVMVREREDALYEPDGFRDFPTGDQFREYVGEVTGSDPNV